MSPRTTEQYDKLKKDRKNEILDVALELFGNKGFTQTSISAIAKEAGISKGLMYNYFESKADLLDGVIQHFAEDTMHFFADIMVLEDANEVLVQLITRTGKFLKEKREYNTLITSLSLQKDVHSVVRDFADKKMVEMMPFLENLLKQQGFENPEEEAVLFGAIIDGMSVQFLSTENEAYLNKTIQLLLKRYTV
mgnify:CR=1 FL=1